MISSPRLAPLARPGEPESTTMRRDARDRSIRAFASRRRRARRRRRPLDASRPPLRVAGRPVATVAPARRSMSRPRRRARVARDRARRATPAGVVRARSTVCGSIVYQTLSRPIGGDRRSGQRRRARDACEMRLTTRRRARRQTTTRDARDRDATRPTRWRTAAGSADGVRPARGRERRKGRTRAPGVLRRRDGDRGLGEVNARAEGDG